VGGGGGGGVSLFCLLIKNMMTNQFVFVCFFKLFLFVSDFGTICEDILHTVLI